MALSSENLGIPSSTCVRFLLTKTIAYGNYDETLPTVVVDGKPSSARNLRTQTRTEGTGMKKNLAAAVLFIVIGLTFTVFFSKKVSGFYADMVLNSKAEKAGMPPVVFPHWLHRVEFKCKVCHPAIFEMRSGANDIDMKKIVDGQFCGKCHNGTISWRPVNCGRCHAGRVGMKTGPLEGFPQ